MTSAVTMATPSLEVHLPLIDKLMEIRPNGSDNAASIRHSQESNSYASVRPNSELQHGRMLTYYLTLPGPHSQHSQFTCRTGLAPTYFPMFSIVQTRSKHGCMRTWPIIIVAPAMDLGNISPPPPLRCPFHSLCVIKSLTNSVLVTVFVLIASLL